MDIDQQSQAQHREVVAELVELAWRKARERYPAAGGTLIREVAMSYLRSALEEGFARTCYTTGR